MTWTAASKSPSRNDNAYGRQVLLLRQRSLQSSQLVSASHIANGDGAGYREYRQTSSWSSQAQVGCHRREYELGTEGNCRREGCSQKKWAVSTLGQVSLQLTRSRRGWDLNQSGSPSAASRKRADGFMLGPEYLPTTFKNTCRSTYNRTRTDREQSSHFPLE